MSVGDRNIKYFIFRNESEITDNARNLSKFYPKSKFASLILDRCRNYGAKESR